MSKSSTGKSSAWFTSATLAFLNPVFAASYYVVSKEALHRFNPFVFTAIETAIVAPLCFFKRKNF